MKLLSFSALLAVFWLALAPADQTPPPSRELITNRDYLTRLTQDVRAATDSIDIVMYSIQVNLKRRNDVVHQLLDDLIAARDRGVRVTLVLDQGRYPRDKKTCPSTEAADYLRQHDVPVTFEDPEITTHAKAVVIDSRIVYLGSSNWSYSAFRRNNELNLRLIDRPLAQEVTEFIQKVRTQKKSDSKE